MYLRDLADSLLRRWILVVVALMMTGGVCFVASRAIAPTFETTASIVLVPPKSVADPTANRFLELSGLSQAGDVLTRALNADTAQEKVHEKAPEGEYEVMVDDATSAPVLVIKAEAPTADEADALVDAVLQQAPADLATLQSALSISSTAQIALIPLTRDDEPRASQTSRLRAVAVLGVLCLAGGAVLIGALDGILLVRSARKELKRRRDGATVGALPEDDAASDDAWLKTELAAIAGNSVRNHE